MTPPIAPADLAVYQRTAVLREQRRQRLANERRETAWLIAHQAAKLLKEQFGATQVIVYGSLAHGHWFRLESDIDLAAKDIPPALFWRAWSALDHIDPAFEINLIALETATDSLRSTIESEGVDL